MAEHEPHEHADRRRLGLALVLTLGFMLAEVVGGVISGSLALLADAAHMATDALSLALAWLAAVFSARPADEKRSYGYARLQILAAFVNGLSLFVLIAWIVWEAVHRLMTPAPVSGLPVMVIAAIGLLVNLVVFRMLHGGSEHNLNIRGAALHVLGDLLGSVAALLSGLVIWRTGWTPIDPLLSLLVAALIARSAWRLTRQSAHILLEGTPTGLDAAEVASSVMVEVDGVHSVHHVHAWALSPAQRMLTMHVVLDEGAPAQAQVAREIKDLLAARFGIEHATIEFERGPDLCAGPHCHPETRTR